MFDDMDAASYEICDGVYLVTDRKYVTPLTVIHDPMVKDELTKYAVTITVTITNKIKGMSNSLNPAFLLVVTNPVISE